MTQEETFIVTTAEALRFLRTVKRVKFWIGARVDKPGSVFPSYAVVKVSRTQAMKWVNSASGDTLEKRGGRIEIKKTGDNIYV